MTNIKWLREFYNQHGGLKDFSYNKLKNGYSIYHCWGDGFQPKDPKREALTSALRQESRVDRVVVSYEGTSQMSIFGTTKVYFK